MLCVRVVPKDIGTLHRPTRVKVLEDKTMDCFFTTVISITLLSLPVFAQNPRKPAFETVEIQASIPGDKLETAFQPNGKVTMRYVTLKEMVAAAWSLKADYVSARADIGIDKEHYNVIAKAASNAPEPELREMLKNLLIDRFQLQVHSEKKTMPVFGMVVGEKGAQLHDASTGMTGATCELQQPDGKKDTPVLRTFACQRLSMDDLAGFLPRMATAYIDRPVVNLTELQGSYDFTLAWVPRSSGPQQPDGPTIFTALETQLGLRLQQKEYSMDTIVIDKAERIPVH
jgi:uncharacterized protein (TIGR03435 family)